MINRRNFIKGIMAAAALPSLTVSKSYASAAKVENMLAVPPLLEKTRSGGVSRFSISVQEGVSEFVKGSPVNTLGYNGNLLGKTIRAKKGEKVSISVKNNLKEHTTTHWHGLLVPGNMDGGPHQVIKPGETWNASFTIEQPAATAWYHPHGDGNTASQVYKGLGGLFLLDDENSAKLDIPDEYGVNDVPLVIQDRLFSEDGQIHYLTSRQDYIFGMKGNKVLVNGVLEPTFEAPKGKVRFRILNGSNARTYNLYFSNKQSFDIIASDGGFLPKPAKMNSIRISPGERYEIIADFSAHKPGSEIYLADSGYNFMKVIVSSKKGFTGALPEKLAEYDPADMSKVVASRRFYMNGMGNMVNINGRRMDMRRINEYMTLGTTEIWNVVSRMGMMRGGSSDILHNFHAHGTLFKVISRNGKPPAPEERGWKDTVALPDNEVVQLMASFNHKGIFMYHCHILEHEDRGMMGQYIVK